jgi:hypothetical protein
MAILLPRFKKIKIKIKIKDAIYICSPRREVKNVG